MRDVRKPFGSSEDYPYFDTIEDSVDLAAPILVSVAEPDVPEETFLADDTDTAVPVIPPSPTPTALVPDASSRELKERFPDHAHLAKRAMAIMTEAKAPNTRRAYQQDWDDFTTWCDARGLIALPALPEVVILYLTALDDAGKRLATITRRVVAINKAHQHANAANPIHTAEVETFLDGLRRLRGVAQKEARPLMIEDLRRMCDALPDTLLGKRDRALLTLGFGAALRESELVALEVGDVEEVPEGLKVFLRRSKTDQEGEGCIIAVVKGASPATCPVIALTEYLSAAGITAGKLFRGITRGDHLRGEHLAIRAIDDIIRRCARLAGIDPEGFSGHSLRAGHISTAARAGTPEWVIQRTSRHKSTEMLRRYIRGVDLWQNASSAKLGL